MTFDEIQEKRVAEARMRATQARAALTPAQLQQALVLERAIDKNLASLLRRTTAGPDNGKGRQALQTTPPAPGEECSIAELRKAGLL